MDKHKKKTAKSMPQFPRDANERRASTGFVRTKKRKKNNAVPIPIHPGKGTYVAIHIPLIQRISNLAKGRF